jgi:hypothetical protein
VWEEAIVAYLKALSAQSPEKTEKPRKPSVSLGSRQLDQNLRFIAEKLRIFACSIGDL